MSRQPIEWLITDTHLHHAKMMEIGRPENYEQLILNNCRAKIKPEDRLYHLGDTNFGKREILKIWLDQIECQKILIRGNHDRESRRWYERNGFDFVADIILIGNILLSHKPIEFLPEGTTLNIHGHWHNTTHRHHESLGWYDHSKYKKLAMEDTNYHPVNLEKFKNL